MYFGSPCCGVIRNIPFKSTNISFDSLIKLLSSIERIEKVEYQAALEVTGCGQGTSRNKLYYELGRESLAPRRWARRLIQLFKVISTKSPAYLYQLLAELRIPTHGIDSVITFREIRFNNNKCRDSFFPESTK